MITPIRLLRTGGGVALATSVVLAAGCGKDDAPDPSQLADELISETDGALERDQADCVAAGLVTSFGDDAFERVIGAADGRDDDVRIEVIDIFASCDALDAVVLDP